jgi:predicted transcriptional regulator
MSRISELFQPIIQRIEDWQREQRISKLESEFMDLMFHKNPMKAEEVFQAMSLEIHSRSICQVQRMEKQRGLV